VCPLQLAVCLPVGAENRPAAKSIGRLHWPLGRACEPQGRALETRPPSPEDKTICARFAYQSQSAANSIGQRAVCSVHCALCTVRKRQSAAEEASTVQHTRSEFGRRLALRAAHELQLQTVNGPLLSLLRAHCAPLACRRITALFARFLSARSQTGQTPAAQCPATAPSSAPKRVAQRQLCAAAKLGRKERVGDLWPRETNAD